MTRSAVPSPPPRRESLTIEVARWLVSPAGREAVASAVEALDGGEDELAVGEGLRDEGLDHARAVAVLDAALARRAARPGHPDADRLMLTRAGLEQRSRPEVAAWRARRFQDDWAVDLCAGLGGDAAALATCARGLVAVERHPARALLLDHNTAGRGVAVVRGDALAAPVRAGLAVHADPGRRRGGRRARWLAQYHPPVPDLLAALERARPRGVGVTVSPGLSWHDRDLPARAEVEFVQVGNDLVEAVLWLGALRRGDRRATATLLPAAGEPGRGDRGDALAIRSRSGPPTPLPVGEIGAVLLEVAPAAVRARLHDDLGREVGAYRIARRRALLTAADAPPSSWWTRWAVEAVLPPRPGKVAAWLRGAEPGPLSIAVHGLDASPERWFGALGSPERGPRGRRLHLIRTDEGAVAVATHPLGPPESGA